VIAKFANGSARLIGRLLSFGIAMILVLAWLATDPLFDLSDWYRMHFNKK
jgi:low affinity Fe/Cu permease